MKRKLLLVISKYNHLIIVVADKQENLTGPEGNNLPYIFDPRRLTKLNCHQISFLEETHPKAVVSTGYVKEHKDVKVEVNFPLNIKGIFLLDGNYLDDWEKVVKVKYSDEVILWLGVDYVKLNDGTIVERRFKAIDYTVK